MYIFLNYKACENLLLYVFNNKISRKKIKGKKKIIVQESCQMFKILYLYLIAFEYVLIAKNLFKKKAVCNF